MIELEMVNRDDRTISEMRNLGPACEADLNAVGIFTAQQVIDLGVEETFLRVLIGRKANSQPLDSCNANYLYALHGAIHDIDWRELPEDLKIEYRRLATDIRQSRQF